MSKTIGVRVSDELAKALEDRALKERRTVSAMANLLLEDVFEKELKENVVTKTKGGDNE